MSKPSSVSASSACLCLLLPLILTSCALFQPRTTPQYAPPSGCSERSAVLLPPPPPKDTDWRQWALAYVGALSAFTDSENARRVTADCLDRLREPRHWWER